ncbi:hypothetical protein F2Q68_00004555 [Brassica cretica]|uniref:Uncharacterized protein n=1 Tax=Brassica cretica TaxID=69181 RepID=A0A8S9JGY3_BRACR|nr:hypothetical protein F2Q68_00004555 [Brassica cretica]
MAPLLGYFDHSRGSIKQPYKDMTCATGPTLKNEKVEGELEGDNEVSLGLEKDAGKNGNSGSGIAFVGALLAELEDLPAPILQNKVGTAQSASNEEGVGKRAGKEIVTEEQPEWNDVPYRNRPSLDEPEVTKVSFDVASGTISPSRFKVLETLNEEEEGLDVLEEGEMHEYAWIWGVPVDRCPRQFGSYIATWFALDRSLRNDPTKGLVGRYVATGSFAGRSLRSDRPSGLVSRFVTTDSFAGRSLRSDRPSGLVSRYVATDSFAGRSLHRWHWKDNSKIYLVSKDGLNQTMGRSSSIAKHLTRLCSSVPQKVRMNELDCVFGSVIHFSRGSCSGAFFESVLRKRSYRNRVSVFVDRRDENLKVEGVQGQTQTRSERGEIGSEGLDSGMDWTYGEEQDVMGKLCFPSSAIFLQDPPG